MTREYIITLVNDTSQTKQSPVAGDTEPKESAKREQVEKDSGFIKATKMFAMYKTAENLANTFISYDINTISLRTGQSEKQERISFAYQTSKRILDVATSIGVGAAMGGGIGAVIGLTYGITRELISLYQREELIQTRKNIEDISIRLANQRAGVSMSRGNALIGE